MKLSALNRKDNMSHNKVYVNPNFSKVSCNSILPDNSAVYVNTKFSNAALSVDNKQTVSTKIYINPNFIKTAHPQTSVSKTLMINCDSVNNINSCENLVNSHKQNSKTDKTLLSTVKNKSRYSLVRFNKIESMNVTVTKIPTNTVRISKHKLIPLNNVKNIIANKKCSGSLTLKNINGPALTQNQNIRPTVINISKNSHKFVKYKPPSVSELLVRKCDGSAVSKVVINEKSSPTLKIKLRKNFKKNNIPCPLFKKFGKCIRLAHGHCDFLHDKRHVSICRKFLKGVCHDAECLLSHELTVKKMPTCYFYLKGVCNKKDCPYLHVKLSEKSKVCPDFLKGYCEKGKKCLNRHVNISLNTTVRTVKTSKICTPKYETQFANHNYKKNCVQIHDVNNKKSDLMKKEHDSKGCTTEYRYYQDLNDEVITEKETCEIIKPTRCKLGALPSFIQL